MKYTHKGCSALVVCLALAVCAQAGLKLDVTTTQTFSGSITANTNNDYMYVRNGATLTYDGSWDNGFSGAKTYWYLSEGAKLVLGPNAQLNNNMSDLINARDFSILGTGTGEVLEYDTLFDANHTGYVPGMTPSANVSNYGGDGSWDNNALTTLRVGGLTMISHHTRNLATADKLGNDINNNLVHTHHGLLVFDQGSLPETTWIVRSNDQVYDGGILWSTDWTLNAERDLSYTGDFQAQHKVTFGSRGSVAGTLTKTGSAALNINGMQAYTPGATIRVEQGDVNINYDPSYLKDIYTIWNWPESTATQNDGENLVLDVQADGRVNFNVASGVQSLSSAGEIGLLLGDADKALAALVNVRLDLVQGGDLVIADDGTLTVGTYDLFDAGSFAGSFHLVLPAGYAGSYDNGTGELTLTAVPEPATAMLLLAAGAFAVRRRRA